jgi:hypothetical protein
MNKLKVASLGLAVLTVTALLFALPVLADTMSSDPANTSPDSSASSLNTNNSMLTNQQLEDLIILNRLYNNSNIFSGNDNLARLYILDQLFPGQNLLNLNATSTLGNLIIIDHLLNR